MRRVHIIILVALIISALMLGAVMLTGFLEKDDTLPEIRCPDEPLRISVNGGVDGLLADVSAWDGKDGDITDRLLVQQVERYGEDGELQVIYAVSDSDRHVVTRRRTVVYTDYVPPRFELTQELRYPEGSTIRIRDRLSAQDVLDGNIGDRIKLTAGNVSSYYEGSYPLTVEVTNSLGDTSSLQLELEIRGYAAGEPRITLKQYIVYLEDGLTLKPESYILEVTGAKRSQVRVELPDGGLKDGVNRVTYTCKGESGVFGKATLYVVLG